MKDSEVAISIIVPVYNLEKYIRECIDSILNQSFTKYELILVDDCSDDNTPQIIKEYISSQNSMDIILLNNNKNLGAGYSRNKGLDIARGEYLLFLDGDDMFEKNMLERLYSVCEKNRADIVIYNYAFYDDRTSKSIEYNTPIDMFIKPEDVFKLTRIKDIAFQNFHEIAWNKIFRKEFIQKNDIRFQCQNNANDQYFVFASLLKAQRIVKIPDHLLKYRKNRVNQLSASENISQKPLCIWNATRATLDYINNLGVYDLYNKSFNIYIITRLLFSLNNINLEAKKKLLKFYKERGFKALKINNCSFEDFGVPYYFAIYKWLLNLKSPEMLTEAKSWKLWTKNSKCQELLEKLMNEKNIVIWGAGKNCALFLEKAKHLSKLDIRYVVDMDESKVGQIIDGYKIKNYKDIDDENLILALNPNHILMIQHQMTETKKKVKILDVQAYICFNITFEQAKIDFF